MMMETLDADGRLTAWCPQPGPQAAFVDCPVFECFFGGARGGGKTEAVIGEWAIHAAQYGVDAIGLMIRRTRVELDETFERAKSIYTKIGVHATYNPRRFIFPNGARITYAYLERDPMLSRIKVGQQHASTSRKRATSPRRLRS